MIDTLIVHGSYGSPLENWFPWLFRSVQAAGAHAILPHFPNDDLQFYSLWAEVLDCYRPHLSDDLTVFGHSLAPAFIVDYVVERKLHLKKAILVAPFYEELGIDRFDEVNRTFFVNKDYLRRFRDLCDTRICVFSDNDPYVPISKSEEFANDIGAEIKIVPGGGHLNTSSGFTEFPLLLEL